MRADPYAGTPELISMVDGFDDASIDTNVWGTKVENGGSGVAEAGGFLTIANAAGAAGVSYLPTLHNYGDYMIAACDITIVNGEAAGDGERCEASLVWYKDADNYIKWGAYRDTSGAINSSGYLRVCIGGVLTSTDLTSAVVDNSEHTFKIKKHESQIEIYYDGTYKTGFAFPTMIGYYVRLEAGTENAGDTIDVDFDDFKLFNLVDPFGTDLTGIVADLATVDANIDTLLTRLSAARAGYLDYINGSNTTVGSGTLSVPLNGVSYSIEFTTAAFGSVFEITFIGDLDAANGFDTNAKANTVLDISYYKKIGGAYTSLPQDVWAVQKDVTLDRNVEIDHIRCGEDTKVTFQVDLIPDDTIEIPYRYIVRRLKE